MRVLSVALLVAAFVLLKSCHPNPPPRDVAPADSEAVVPATTGQPPATNPDGK